MGKKSPGIKIITSWHEISRRQYIARYGQQSLNGDLISAVAERIAMVNLNPVILKPQTIKKGEHLIFSLFDETDYIITVINKNVEGVKSFRGRVDNTDAGFLYMSIHEGKVLASLEIAEHNLHCLLKCNPQTHKHYLFKARADQIIRPLKR